MRTHTCGELRKQHAGQTVTLCGWVHASRIQGKVAFVDIKDRYGLTQLLLRKDLVQQVQELKDESVIKIEGEVKVRPQGNPNIATGEIEVSVTKLEVLSKAAALPLQLNEDIESTEETRLTYRYLDLRTPTMQRNMILRHNIIKAFRDFLHQNNFIEIETPLLAKSTPEGARDYLVPSRLHKGQFYALPQSPQIFKQLLMVAGYDRYYQFARCMRDEDLRADRQPEFTQLDMEMSFADEEDVRTLMEAAVKHVWKEVLGTELSTFPVLTYDEAIKKYNTDKPDLRKDKKNPKEFAFAWIIDFPLFEQTDQGLATMHHPFTHPKDEDIPLLEKEPLKVRAKAYDLVCNGWEISSGSIRISTEELQNKIFKALKLSEEEIKNKFGFLLNAFKYGVPPHGGMAPGIDRLVAIAAGEHSIKDVIAFPKNKEARDLMLHAPSTVSKEQLDELHITLKK